MILVEKGPDFWLFASENDEEGEIEGREGKRWDVFVVDEQEAPQEPDSGRPVIYAEEAQEIVAAFNYEFVLDCSHHSQAGGSSSSTSPPPVSSSSSSSSSAEAEVLKRQLDRRTPPSSSLPPVLLLPTYPT